MKNTNAVYIALAVVGVAFLAVAALVIQPTIFVSDGGFSGESSQEASYPDKSWVPSENVAAAYDPEIDPSDFVESVGNKYFSLVPGTKFTYEAETGEGTERIEVYVTDEKKTVMGVPVTVVWDRVWLEGDLIEDTRDWYAQDGEGNVWYFGEDTMELENGMILNHNGAFEAGVDGAKPGVVMRARPSVGDEYRQEYYPGVAEDMGRVLSLDEAVSTPFGSFEGCLKTLDWNPLEGGPGEHKYYCPEAGFVVLEVGLEDNEMAKLVGLERDSQPSPSVVVEAGQNLANANETALNSGVTEDDARKIALAEVPGKVTDVVKEIKFGKLMWVVEVRPDNGYETDVVIDIDTGEVVDVET